MNKAKLEAAIASFTPQKDDPENYELYDNLYDHIEEHHETILATLKLALELVEPVEGDMPRDVLLQLNRGWGSVEEVVCGGTKYTRTTPALDKLKGEG